MSVNPAVANSPPKSASSTFEILRLAQSIVRHESAAIESFASNIPIEFADAVSSIHNCSGAVIVTGIGKAGWIGQKLSASFASTGTRSHFMHPSEAFHGDFGRVGPEDLVLILSNSGETEEVLRILPTVSKMQVTKIAITASEQCTLSKNCDVTIPYGRVQEACSLGLAPTTSTALMLAIGDALALTVSNQKGFSSMDFAKFHPGGSLGRKLQKVEEAMRPIRLCRSCSESTITRNAISSQVKNQRRTGAILIHDDENKLTGIFTDSDLVRLLENKDDHLLDQPIQNLMTPHPKSITAGEFVSSATSILSEFSISELPVVNSRMEPLGIIDITDVI